MRSLRNSVGQIMERRKILIIGMFDSIHLARWLSQFENEKIDFILFSHPDEFPSLKSACNSVINNINRLVLEVRSSSSDSLSFLLCNVYSLRIRWINFENPSYFGYSSHFKLKWLRYRKKLRSSISAFSDF